MHPFRLKSSSNFSFFPKRKKRRLSPLINSQSFLLNKKNYLFQPTSEIVVNEQEIDKVQIDIQNSKKLVEDYQKFCEKELERLKEEFNQEKKEFVDKIESNKKELLKKIEIFKKLNHKLKEDDFHIQTHTDLTPLLTNCYDSFEIIFSFLSQFDIIHNVCLSCSFFRNLVFQKIGLNVVIYGEMLNSQPIHKSLSNFKLKTLSVRRRNNRLIGQLTIIDKLKSILKANCYYLTEFKMVEDLITFDPNQKNLVPKRSLFRTGNEDRPRLRIASQPPTFTPFGRQTIGISSNNPFVLPPSTPSPPNENDKEKKKDEKDATNDSKTIDFFKEKKPLLYRLYDDFFDSLMKCKKLQAIETGSVFYSLYENPKSFFSKLLELKNLNKLTFDLYLVVKNFNGLPIDIQAKITNIADEFGSFLKSAKSLTSLNLNYRTGKTRRSVFGSSRTTKNQLKREGLHIIKRIIDSTSVLESLKFLKFPFFFGDTPDAFLLSESFIYFLGKCQKIHLECFEFSLPFKRSENFFRILDSIKTNEFSKIEEFKLICLYNFQNRYTRYAGNLNSEQKPPFLEELNTCLKLSAKIPHFKIKVLSSFLRMLMFELEFPKNTKDLEEITLVLEPHASFSKQDELFLKLVKTKEMHLHLSESIEGLSIGIENLISFIFFADNFEKFVIYVKKKPKRSLPTFGRTINPLALEDKDDKNRILLFLIDVISKLVNIERKNFKTLEFRYLKTESTRKTAFTRVGRFSSKREKDRARDILIKQVISRKQEVLKRYKELSLKKGFKLIWFGKEFNSFEKNLQNVEESTIPNYNNVGRTNFTFENTGLYG